MPENQTIHKYQSRMDRVINYIYAHLDDEIDLNHLAEVACMSPYHWHRIYRGFSGETIAATVKRLRLHRSANQLVNTNMSLQSIVVQSGYSSNSAFSRAFIADYGFPPAQYRQRGQNPKLRTTAFERTEIMHNVEIKEIDNINLIGLEHVGPYMEIGRAFEKLMGWGAQVGLVGPGMQSYAAYYDDPELVQTKDLRSFAGLLEITDVSISAPYMRRVIDGGKYAVMCHKGPYSELPASYNWLYGSWLVQSGQNLRDAPCLEAYLNNPREVSPSDLLTDIYMPIE